MKTTIVHTPTQRAFDEVMGFVKSTGKPPLRSEQWLFAKQKTCVRLTDEEVDSCDKNFYKTYHLYQDIPIISLKQFKDQMKTKTPTPAAKKSAIQKEQIIYQFITTTKTKWQIIKIGKEYMTRHVSPNGNILALNPKQFNRVQSAFKNIRVNAGAQLMLNKAAKVMKLPLTNISSYQKCYLK